MKLNWRTKCRIAKSCRGERITSRQARGHASEAVSATALTGWPSGEAQMPSWAESPAPMEVAFEAVSAVSYALQAHRAEGDLVCSFKNIEYMLDTF